MVRRILFGLCLLALLRVAALAQVPPPVPALPDTARITDYALSNSTCACAVNFQIYGDQTDVDNWINVQLNGQAVLSTDPTFGWKLTSPSGQLGSIARPITDAILTFNSPQTGTVQITGARRPRRLSQFPENRGVTARDLNVALSDIVAQNRENWDRGGGGGGGGGLPTVSPSTVLGNFAGLPQTAGAQAVPPCAADGAHALTNAASGGFGCTFVSGGAGTPTTPFIVTNGITSRSDADRWNDRGYNIKEFGAKGDGSSHRLSTIYGSLAAAQAVYPFVSDLTQEVDWAASQQAINTGYTIGAAQSAYCPAVPASGGYTLSNPLQIMNSPLTNSTLIGTYGWTNWAAGTTYGNNANVIYNGVPWLSNGAGNVGNRPTSVNSYPANLAIQSGANGGLPYAQVTVSSASPAVVTLTGHGFSAGQPFIFYAQTYSDVTYPSPALPTGVSANQVYYVISTGLTANTFEFSATPGGAAVNTSSTGSGVITIGTQVWQFAAQGSPDFGSRANLIGDPGIGTGSAPTGCIFNFNGWQSAAAVVGGYNGNLIQSVRFHGPGYGGAAYRCQMPLGSNGTSNGAIGLGNVSDGGGTHVSVFDKVETSGFNTGFMSTVGGGGTLGDSNTFLLFQSASNCTGLNINSQENFINSAYDSTVNGDTTGFSATLGSGFHVFGGNHSAGSAQANVFTITGVSAANNKIQATVTNPDGYLNYPMCGYNRQCVYNIFNIATPTAKYGVIPFQLDGYNPATGVINLEIQGGYMSRYGNTYGSTDLNTVLAAATTLYAAETVTTYLGDIYVEGGFVENPQAPTTLISAFANFASGNATLKNVLLDWGVTDGDTICCQHNFSSTDLARYYAQQNTAFITTGADLVVDNLFGGGNIQNLDRVLISGAPGAGQVFEYRHTVNPQFGSVNNGQTPYALMLPFNMRGPGTSNTFTGQFVFPGVNGNQYTMYNQNAGSSGLGFGVFDSGGPFTSPMFNGADAWRSQQWGASRFLGVRPDPAANPCVTPTQVTALNTPPAITFISALQFVVPQGGSSGTNYQVGDNLTAVGGTFTTAATFQVQSIGGGGQITSLTVTNQSTNSYTVEPASFTVTGGHGSGATILPSSLPAIPWLVNYNIPYPLLWGGTIYHVCDYKGTTQTKYGLQSNNLGFSYFQNLTTTNVPNLSWSGFSNSPIIYMNIEALELMFPGLVFTLTGSASAPCNNATPETFIVTEVYPALGYVSVMNAGQDGSPYLPQWGTGNTCTGTTIGQAAPNLVTPY